MIGALVLIAAGILLLLTNLDIVSSGVWLGMLTLWPVGMIALGLGLLLPGEARMARASLTGIVLVALIVGGVTIDQRELPARGRSAEVQVPQPENMERADIDLEVGAGRLAVASGAAEDEVVTGTVGLSRGQRLVADSAEQEGAAQVRVAAEGRWFRLGVNPNRVAPWDLRLTDEAPLHVRVSSGVGEAQLDLRDLLIEEARIDVGVGRTVAYLPRHGRPRVRIDGGVGEVVVHIPEDIPARVAVDTSVGTTSVDGVFRRDGDVYTTSGWDDAEERLDVTIETGIGSVSVVRR